MEAALIPHSKPETDEQSIEAVVKALRLGHLSDGHEVAILEKSLSDMFDGAHVVAVSSGTAALYLSLVAVGVKAGDKVVIPSYTCNSLFSAVSFAGGTAICADTSENSVNINRSTAKSVVDSSTKAIIAPHTCGYSSDIAGLTEIGIPVIEDCAQSIGGRYPDGSLLGSKGKTAILSFFATKLLPAGEGGACITRDPDIADTIRQLRDCDKRTPNPRSFNFKLPDINAALANDRLRTLQSSIERRAKIAGIYDDIFQNKSFRKISTCNQSICFRYLLKISPRSVAAPERDINKFIQDSISAGIKCDRPIWRPLHYTTGQKCPNTETMEKTLVSIPIYPGLSNDEIQVICSTLLMLS